MNWSLNAHKPAVIDQLTPYIFGGKDSKKGEYFIR